MPTHRKPYLITQIDHRRIDPDQIVLTSEDVPVGTKIDLCDSFFRVMRKEHVSRGVGVKDKGWLDEVHTFLDGEQKTRREIWHECRKKSKEGRRLVIKLWQQANHNVSIP